MIRSYYILLVIISFLALETLNAQKECNQNYQNLPLTGDLYEHYYKQYQGTPHLEDKSFKGKVKLVSGDVYSDLELNYDIYLDELVYFNPKLQKVIKLDKNSIDEFWLESEETGGGYHVVNFHETDSSKVSSGFLFLLLNDTISLVSKKIKKITSDNNSTNSSAIIGSFYQKETWYYILNNHYIAVPKSARHLYKQFPAIKKELRTFIKTNHYSLKKEFQIVAVFKEVNKHYK